MENKKVILIVDDVPENLSLLGDILEPHYQIRVANSGQRALAIADREPIADLILLDIMMPEMDGYEVLKRLQSQEITRDIPVIFVTAKDGDDDEVSGLEMGAVDYITKPFQPAIVLARVHTQLQIHEAKRILSDQNAWLEDEISQRMHENEIVQDVTMRALANMAEIRDLETGNHIIRTQRYVEVLARELAKTEKYREELTEEKIKLIVKASPLHDIGKIGIPDHILLKPGKLDPDEWKVMKKHASLGAKAIWQSVCEEPDQKPLQFLHMAMDIAHYHHEKWDGSGYPDGLSADDIPISARLMALADVFDALISKRVYKSEHSLDETTSIIRKGKGTHFDPLVVEAFENTRDQFISIAREYS